MNAPKSERVEMSTPSVTAMLLGPLGGVRVYVEQFFKPGEFDPDNSEVADEEDGSDDYKRSA